MLQDYIYDEEKEKIRDDFHQPDRRVEQAREVRLRPGGYVRGWHYAGGYRSEVAAAGPGID